MVLLETIIKKPDVFLESLFRAATCSADPKHCLPPQLKNIINAPPKGKVVVIGAGKAAASMANVFENFWLKSWAKKSWIKNGSQNRFFDPFLLCFWTYLDA